jgi:hypothetical protein
MEYLKPRKLDMAGQIHHTVKECKQLASAPGLNWDYADPRTVPSLYGRCMNHMPCANGWPSARLRQPLQIQAYPDTAYFDTVCRLHLGSCA